MFSRPTKYLATSDPMIEGSLLCLNLVMLSHLREVLLGDEYKLNQVIPIIFAEDWPPPSVKMRIVALEPARSNTISPLSIRTKDRIIGRTHTAFTLAGVVIANICPGIVMPSRFGPQLNIGVWTS